MGGRRSNGEGSLRRVAGRDLYQYRWTEWVDQGACGGWTTPRPARWR